MYVALGSRVVLVGTEEEEHRTIYWKFGGRAGLRARRYTSDCSSSVLGLTDLDSLNTLRVRLIRLEPLSSRSVPRIWDRSHRYVGQGPEPLLHQAVNTTPPKPSIGSLARPAGLPDAL